MPPFRNRVNGVLANEKTLLEGESLLHITAIADLHSQYWNGAKKADLRVKTSINNGYKKRIVKQLLLNHALCND